MPRGAWRRSSDIGRDLARRAECAPSLVAMRSPRQHHRHARRSLRGSTRPLPSQSVISISPTRHRLSGQGAREPATMKDEERQPRLTIISRRSGGLRLVSDRVASWEWISLPRREHAGRESG